MTNSNEYLTMNQILEAVISEGLDPKALTEADVEKYADKYRRPHILVRDLALIVSRKENKPKTRKRSKPRPQRTQGRSAESIVKELTFDSLIEAPPIPFMGEPVEPNENGPEWFGYCVDF